MFSSTMCAEAGAHVQAHVIECRVYINCAQVQAHVIECRLYLYLLCAEAGAYVQAHAAYCIYFFGDIALLQGIAAFVQNLFKHMRTC